MVQFKVGDSVVLCASIDDFCGTSNAYLIKDINISMAPCSINTFTSDCLTFSGININFGWTTQSSDPLLNVCPTMLSVLGSATTNTQGVASLTYTITQQDLDFYNANSSSFDLAACITNSTVDVQNGIRSGFRAGDAIVLQSSTPLLTTYLIDLIISPYSWYTQQGAVDFLITNLTDINGAIVNWLTPFTGWTYISTEIVNDGSNVIIRVHLNDGSTAAPSILSSSTSKIQTLVAPLTVVGLVLVVGVITLAMGMIIAYALTKVSTGTKEAEKQFTPGEVVGLVITDPDSIVARQLGKCDINFSNNASGLKLCYDSVIEGAQDGLADKLNLPPTTINTPSETQKCLDQYIIDSNWTNYQTCLKSVKDKAGGELLAGVTCPSGQYYNVDQGKCISTENCWIQGFVPGTCMLTAKTGTTLVIISGILIGGYLIFGLRK